jgi:hypothetical protein
MRAWLVALLLLATAGAAGAADLRVIDEVLAEVASRPVTLSEVTLARALGVFGLERSAGPITDADLAKYLDAQLAVRESVQLDVDVSAADLDAAWDRAGGAALAARLTAAGVDPAWARRLIEADRRVQRFVDLRFRAFAFVTDFDIDEALGPGAHDEATRARTREKLRADMVIRAFTAWQEEARQRVPIGRIPGVAGPWPAPFSLDAGAGAR